MAKKYFCTFADSRMQESLSRIKAQAEGMRFFDVISVNNEKDLDTNFKAEFKERLVKGTRGYGYWSWKPQIILQTLQRMEVGDILLYVDAGCHLNKDGVSRLEEYFELASKSQTGLLTFQEGLESPDSNLIISKSHLEKFYTKGDIFDHFGVRDKAEFYNSGIVAATAFLVRKCEASEKIIEDWMNVFKTNFPLVDDSPSRSANFEGFIENRHDQSIFSILCKLHNVSTLSSYEMWQQDWTRLKNYPIWAKRDKKLTFFWLVRQKLRSAIRKCYYILK